MKAKLRTMLLSCLALLLVRGMTSVACAYDVSFSDVPEDSWFYTDVMTLAESGVIGGYPDGTYRPTKKVTTGEALKMILLAAGYPEPEPAASHWARGYLNFAIEQGFLTRYKDISDLDVNMTRGLVAKLAANALGLSDPTSRGLGDVYKRQSRRSAPPGSSAATRTGPIARARPSPARRSLRS